jgi:hypothetical protein
MAVVSALADRMLSAVVPRASAGACCPPDGQAEICFCSGCWRYLKYCHYTCNCVWTCGACYNANYRCC